MRLLPDTHILPWVMQDAPQLSRAARRLLNDAEAIHVSSVSLWAIAIKSALGKLLLDQAELDAQLDQIGFSPLPVTRAHKRALRELPQVHDLHGLHGDPFDRMLVAQAPSEPLHLLTHDRTLTACGDLILLA